MTHPTAGEESTEKKNEDQPLSIEVKNGVLTISIGIDTLAFAYEHNGLTGGFKITDAAGFANDMRGAIDKEDEVGNSPIRQLLDDAMLRAIEDGSTNVEEVPDVNE